MNSGKKRTTCTRKKDHATENEANEAGMRDHKGKYETYECSYCHMWHISTFRFGPELRTELSG